MSIAPPIEPPGLSVIRKRAILAGLMPWENICGTSLGYRIRIFSCVSQALEASQRHATAIPYHDTASTPIVAP